MAPAKTFDSDPGAAFVAAETTKAIITLSTQVGNVAGTIGGFRDEISRMHSELIHMRTAMDFKDEQNMKIVENYHRENIAAFKENSEVITAHKEDDNANFSDLRVRLHRILGAIAGGTAVLIASWAVLQFLIPFLAKR